MEQEELEQELIDIASSSFAFYSNSQEARRNRILAEFDRLKAEIGRLKVANRELGYCLGDSDRKAQAENERLEAELELADRDYALALGWLDKISKPINLYTARARAEQFRGDYPATSQCLEAIADYFDSQEPSEKPEPQQPEKGELVENSVHCAECYYRLCCRIAKESQLAHDKATMVKLPTELWVAERLHSARFEWKSKWRDYKNRENVGGNLYGFMAKELLKLLKEQGEQKP